jgi:uncharacterized membrane protein
MTIETQPRALENIGRGRVEALSDGVFAIVVTLLVLEITVPHVEEHDSMPALARALWALAPKFVSWVISFVTVCAIWLNHHRLFTAVNRIDNALFWLNANLLLWTSFIPFPTALMGDYPTNTIAVSLYGLVMFLSALGFVLLRLHLYRHADLIHETVDRTAFRAGMVHSIAMGPVAYAIGAALAWVSQMGAFVCYAAIAVYFILPQSIRNKVMLRRTSQRGAT